MRHTLIAIGLAAAIGTLSAGATARQVKGVISRTTDDSLQVTGLDKQIATIKVDNRTAYMKWITHKPFQANTQVSRQLAGPGRCVEIETRSDDETMAKLVRISMDDPGTIFDPCRAVR